MTETAVATTPDTSHRATIASLVHRLAPTRLGPGQLASLRRGDAGAVLQQPAFHRLTSDLGERDLAGDGAIRWATVIQGLALTGSTPDMESAGTTFCRLQLSESRFARLLAARGASFRTQVTYAARFVRSKGAPLDWKDLGELVLTEGRFDRRADALRLRLARAYYRALDAVTSERT